MPNCLEAIRFTVKPGCEEELLSLRDRMLADVRAKHDGLLRAELCRLDDGTYLDVLLWESKDHAERANADQENIAGFLAWVSNVQEVQAFKMSDVLHAG